jgi:hypothetical protein
MIFRASRQVKESLLDRYERAMRAKLANRDADDPDWPK